MDQNSLARYGFLGMLLILLYLSYLVIQPFITYLLFSIVLVILAYPLYELLLKRLRRPRMTSILLVIFLILVLVIPMTYAGFILIRDAPAAYESLVSVVNMTALDETLYMQFGIETNLEETINLSVVSFRAHIRENAGNMISGVSTVGIGLFIMFFIMYYLFTEGLGLLKRVQSVIPIPQAQQDKLYVEVAESIHGLINGQIILGILQGVVGGIVLFFLGIPNALLWGFLMMVFSVVPVIGAFLVWLPIAIWLFATGDVSNAIILFILGTVLISQVDTVLRPYVVSKTTHIHPAIVIIGVFGGLAAFGPIGFISGPLILTLLMTVLHFYKETLGVK